MEQPSKRVHPSGHTTIWRASVGSLWHWHNHPRAFSHFFFQLVLVFCKVNQPLSCLGHLPGGQELPLSSSFSHVTGSSLLKPHSFPQWSSPMSSRSDPSSCYLQAWPCGLQTREALFSLLEAGRLDIMMLAHLHVRKGCTGMSSHYNFTCSNMEASLRLL